MASVDSESVMNVLVITLAFNLTKPGNQVGLRLLSNSRIAFVTAIVPISPPNSFGRNRLAQSPSSLKLSMAFSRFIPGLFRAMFAMK